VPFPGFGKYATVFCLALLTRDLPESAAPKDPVRCAISGWGDTLDGRALPVLEKPDRRAKITGHFPVDAEDRLASSANAPGKRELAEFEVLERRGRWLRVGDARIVTLTDASWEVRNSDLAGWVPADAIRFSIESGDLHAAPSPSAAILFSAVSDIGATWSRFEDCRGAWARVTLSADNMASLSRSGEDRSHPVAGWVTSVCGSAMTGCDYPAEVAARQLSAGELAR
jgi:hypothetical protein